MRDEEKLSDQELIRRFKDLTLPKEAFSHREHVRLAWALLRSRPWHVAFRDFASGLKKFTQHHDVTGLYHETITFFFLHAIADRLRRMPLQHGWHTFARKNPDLVGDPGKFLRAHYTSRILESQLARHHFVLPDVPKTATGCEKRGSDRLGGASWR